MTEKVNPSRNRPAVGFSTSGAIAYGGQGHSDGFIVDPSEPTGIAQQDPAINHTQFDGFDEQSSSSSLDVTIGPGEAFVFGSWIAKDSDTIVTVPQSTLDGVIYLGWDKTDNDEIIIGTNSDFNNDANDYDKRMPLFEFNSNTNGVTDITDLREIGYSSEVRGRLVFGDEQFSIENNSNENKLELSDEIAGDVSKTVTQTWSDSGDVSFPNGRVQAEGNLTVTDTNNNIQIQTNDSGPTTLNNVDLDIDAGTAITVDGTNLIEPSSDSIQLNDPDGDAQIQLHSTSTGGTPGVEISLYDDSPNDHFRLVEVGNVTPVVEYQHGATKINFNAVDIELDTGYAIADDNGNERFGIDALETNIYDDSGNRIIAVDADGIDITGLTTLGSFTSQPSGAAVGSLWYRSDLD
jgi:hypothetical protein